MGKTGKFPEGVCLPDISLGCLENGRASPYRDCLCYLETGQTPFRRLQPNPGGTWFLLEACLSSEHCWGLLRGQEASRWMCRSALPGRGPAPSISAQAARAIFLNPQKSAITHWCTGLSISGHIPWNVIKAENARPMSPHCELYLVIQQLPQDDSRSHSRSTCSAPSVVLCATCAWAHLIIHRPSKAS